MHSLLDPLAADGHFETLTQANELIFQAIFIATGILLLNLAILLAARPNWFARHTEVLHRFSTNARALRDAIRIQKNSRSDILFLVAIETIAIILRLVRLMEPMEYDEAYTAVNFARSLWTAITDYNLPNNHILHTILVYFSMQVFGIQPWAVRLPALIAGILLPFALYYLSKAFYDRNTGLLAALLAALYWPLISFSINSRGYMLMTLLTIVALGLASFLVRNVNLLGWFLFSMAIALGFYTVPVMLFPAGIILLWLFLEGWVQGGRSYGGFVSFARYWTIFSAITIFATLVLYLPVLIYTGPSSLFQNHFVKPLHWDLFLGSLPQGLNIVRNFWFYHVPAGLFFLCIIGLVLSLILHSRISRFRIPLHLPTVLWLAALVIVRRPDPDQWGRLSIFLLPLVIMWVSAGIVGALQLLQPRVNQKIPISRLAIGIPLAVVFLFTISYVPRLPQLWALADTDRFQQLGQWLGEHIGSNDLILAPYPDDAQTQYYALLNGIPASKFDTSKDFSRLIVIVHNVKRKSADNVLIQNGFSPSSCTVSSEPERIFEQAGIYLGVYTCKAP